MLLSYLTFSPATAYFRLIIWEWGFYHNALVNPLFGIGENEWVRPSWMHSTSMDNFWLVQMVTYGIPAFVFLATGTVLFLANQPRALSVAAAQMRKGWVISMIGIMVAGCTVHYWNHSFVWYFFVLGLGGSFHSPRGVKHEITVNVCGGTEGYLIN